jgi:hypothetical protein
MNVPPFFLADEQTDAVLQSWRFASPSTRDAILIFGAIGLVTLLTVLWALFLRRRRRRRRSHHHSHEQSVEPAELTKTPVAESVPPPPPSQHRRRRGRRRHRSRNPTLAETGGLPPIRPESPPESQP